MQRFSYKQSIKLYYARIIFVITLYVQIFGSNALEGAQKLRVNHTQQATACPCLDIPPLGGLTCKEQKGLNKCGEWWMLWGDFCSISCGRCTCELQPTQFKQDQCQCTDLNPPGSGSCQQQMRWGKCEADWMAKKSKNAPNGYCEKTCGRCDCPKNIPPKPKIPSTSNDEAGCICSNIKPDKSQFSCAQQKEMGKCQADWMFNTDIPEGYCQTTCGRCSCPVDQQIQSEVQPCLPFAEFLNRTEGISMYASLFGNEVMDSFMQKNLDQEVTILVPRDEGFKQFLDDHQLDFKKLINDPFLVLQQIVQPNVLSMGAYKYEDFLPKQLLLTQSGFTIQIDEMSEAGWYFSGDMKHHTSLVVQPDVQLCKAVVQIVSQPIISKDALETLQASASKKFQNSSQNFDFEAIPAPLTSFVEKLTKPKTCVPFSEFLEIIDGVKMYGELFKDEVVLSVIEASLKEPVTILVPMDEGFQAFLEQRNQTLEQFREDSFEVINQVVTPSIIPSGAFETSTFEPQQEFVIYQGFNLSVDLMQDEMGSWYFKGEEGDLALISQPDLPLCKAIIHIVTKPLLPKHIHSPPNQNFSSSSSDQQHQPYMSDMLTTLPSYSLPDSQNQDQTPQNSQNYEYSYDDNQVSQQSISSPSPIPKPTFQNETSAPPPPQQIETPPNPTPSPVFVPLIAPTPTPASKVNFNPIPAPTPTPISSPVTPTPTPSSSPTPTSTSSPPPTPTPTPSPSPSPSPAPISNPTPAPNPTNNTTEQSQQLQQDKSSQSPFVPRCDSLQNILKKLDDVSLFTQLFEDEFLRSYMESILQQRMTILVPSDEGLQKFLDQNDLTVEVFLADPFLALVSIIQPNIIIMGAFETSDFIEKQSLLTQSGASLSVDKQQDSTNWFFKRGDKIALIIDSDTPACNTIIHVIDDPLIEPYMLEESAQISGSTINLYNHDTKKNDDNLKSIHSLKSPGKNQQVVNVTMSIQVQEEKS